MDKDQVYLLEIEEFCQTIARFTADVTYDAFLADEKLQLALVKLIENIGEAARKLSERAQQQFVSVDWPKAIAMRNRLVHDYMSIDLEIVYDVAVHEVPTLRAALKQGPLGKNQ